MRYAQQQAVGVPFEVGVDTWWAELADLVEKQVFLWLQVSWWAQTGTAAAVAAASLHVVVVAVVVAVVAVVVVAIFVAAAAAAVPILAAVPAVADPADPDLVDQTVLESLVVSL